jgi:ElaB/YqjD/DUF883 family membrane-anchored ribosome-binding protein
MVSNAIEMDLQELLDTLERLQREHAQDADYQKLRSALPPDWPL